jgi:sialidase-1
MRMRTFQIGCFIFGGLFGLYQASGAPDPASVYAWYRGDAGLVTGSDNYGVISWTNAGAAFTTSPAQQALRDLNHLGGNPQKLYLIRKDGSPAAAVSFDGTDCIYATKTDFGILSSNRTLVACARLADGVSQGFLFDASSYTPGLMRAQVKTGYWHVGTSGGTNSAYGPSLGTPTGTVTTNLWQVHAFIVQTNSGVPKFEHYVDGARVGNVSLSANGALSGLIVGANVSQQFGLKADVAEILVFSQALDAATRAGVEAYLSNKWAGVVADTNAPASPPERLPVFVNGQNGYACYRIPALVTTTNGTVIAVADGRISDCGDIPNPLDLVARRSFDNGRTWGPLQVIATYGSDTSTNDVDIYPYYGVTNPVQRVAAGDAALLVDRTNGRVWTLYDNGAYAAGQAYNRVIKLEMRYSDDDGATWSAALDIEALSPGLRPAGSQFLAGPGNGIQLAGGSHAGRLIFPVYVSNGPSYSTLIYSDDHGQTWHLGGNAGTGGGEVQMAETPDGGLIASMRDATFSWSGVRTFSRSTDGGANWGAPYTNTVNPPAVPDPACQGNIYRLTTTNDSNASRLIHANAASASSRVNMTLRISYDEGATWPVSNQVYAGSSAYSALTKLATTEVGLLFEADNYTRIDFVRRSVSQISGGSDSLPPYTVWAAERFSPAQLMNPAISGQDADPDHDGATNYQEFIAGTDPLSTGSSLKLKVIPAGTNTPLLQFDAVSNKTYTVQHRASLISGAWSRYADVSALPSNTLAQVALAVTNECDFFRLTTPLMP